MNHPLTKRLIILIIKQKPSPLILLILNPLTRFNRMRKQSITKMLRQIDSIPITTILSTAKLNFGIVVKFAVRLRVPGTVIRVFVVGVFIVPVDPALSEISWAGMVFGFDDAVVSAGEPEAFVGWVVGGTFHAELPGHFVS